MRTWTEEEKRERSEQLKQEWREKQKNPHGLNQYRKEAEKRFEYQALAFVMGLLPKT